MFKGTSSSCYSYQPSIISSLILFSSLEISTNISCFKDSKSEDEDVEPFKAGPLESGRTLSDKIDGNPLLNRELNALRSFR